MDGQAGGEPGRPPAAYYGPGKDTLEWFSKAFIAAGGTIVGTLPLTLNTINFTPEMQRMRDRSRTPSSSGCHRGR